MPAFLKTKAFRQAMEAQTRGTFIQLHSECLNITVWRDSGVVFIADNNVKAGGAQIICAKVHDKKKKIGMAYELYQIWIVLIQMYPILSLWLHL